MNSLTKLFCKWFPNSNFAWDCQKKELEACYDIACNGKNAVIYRVMITSDSYNMPSYAEAYKSDDSTEFPVSVYILDLTDRYEKQGLCQKFTTWDEACKWVDYQASDRGCLWADFKRPEKQLPAFSRTPFKSI